MAGVSRIEWTWASWNPITGCSKVSKGCDHCYAERMALRLQAMGQPNYRNGFKVTTHEHVLEKPLRWKKPQMIFVNSMSDLLHHEVPTDFILRIFDVMRRADWHIFQILTKRPKRLLQLDSKLNWPPNVWMGVTAETEKFQWRIDNLRQCGAAIKFLSLEPLLGPIPDLHLEGIDWVIVGGESGPGARPIEEEWVLDLRDQCLAAEVAFFFKQWGGVNKKKSGRLLQGRTWEQLPQKAFATQAGQLALPVG
ncbi:MAG: phage Gp37/Gp68 family protein [bacterium]